MACFEGHGAAGDGCRLLPLDDGSPVAQALLAWYEGRQEWTGTVSQLYGELVPVAEGLRLDRARGWPRDASWLGRRLRELQPVLVALGIDVHGHADGRTTLTIRRVPANGVLAVSPVSPRSAAGLSTDGGETSVTRRAEEANLCEGCRRH